MKMEFYWSFLFLAVAEGKITKLSQSWVNNSSKIFLVTRKKQYASNSNHHTVRKPVDYGEQSLLTPNLKKKTLRLLAVWETGEFFLSEFP